SSALHSTPLRKQNKQCALHSPSRDPATNGRAHRAHRRRPPLPSAGSCCRAVQRPPCDKPMMARAALLPVALLLCLALAGGANAAQKSTAGFYELKNKKGDFSIKVTNWGAALVSAIVPDGKGNLADVVLGYDTVAEYA
uniref:Aldose 1-epimerase n=1 Tax=Aegilops tauschii subsp. strangulata TaxID=200361 RepID=A0A453C4B5_AEGTS